MVVRVPDIGRAPQGSAGVGEQPSRTGAGGEALDRGRPEALRGGEGGDADGASVTGEALGSTVLRSAPRRWARRVKCSRISVAEQRSAAASRGRSPPAEPAQRRCCDAQRRLPPPPGRRRSPRRRRDAAPGRTRGAARGSPHSRDSVIAAAGAAPSPPSRADDVDGRTPRAAAPPRSPGSAAHRRQARARPPRARHVPSAPVLRTLRRAFPGLGRDVR
jgi:hypothetical protein